MHDRSRFLVARNPDPDSTLPYLLRLPIDGGILLKARHPWPTTARVYCHPLEQWPTHAEILEEVPVRSCQRSRQRSSRPHSPSLGDNTPR